jgi:hypothetical protein
VLTPELFVGSQAHDSSKLDNSWLSAGLSHSLRRYGIIDYSAVFLHVLIIITPVIQRAKGSFSMSGVKWYTCGVALFSGELFP